MATISFSYQNLPPALVPPRAQDPVQKDLRPTTETRRRGAGGGPGQSGPRPARLRSDAV